uniref:Uncharacterized protein n=1 Tax=Salvator merianae TaxID=96440 RepID=A0A8D0DTA3_SALMN
PQKPGKMLLGSGVWHGLLLLLPPLCIQQLQRMVLSSCWNKSCCSLLPANILYFTKDGLMWSFKMPQTGVSFQKSCPHMTFEITPM